MKKCFYLVMLGALGMVSCTSTPEKNSSEALTKDSVVSLVKSAFIFSMPLALMDMTHKKVTNTVKLKDGVLMAPSQPVGNCHPVSQCKVQGCGKTECGYLLSYRVSGPGIGCIGINCSEYRWPLLPFTHAGCLWKCIFLPREKNNRNPGRYIFNYRSEMDRNDSCPA